MYISGGNDRLSCKLLPGTLRGVAMQWMATLPPRSIQTFKDLAGSFVSQFVANKVKKLEVANLFDIKQTEGESLKSYLVRFNNATVRVDDPDQKFFVKAFQKGLREGPFSDALALKKPVNMEEIHARAEKHVEMEEDQCERRKLERRSDWKDGKVMRKDKDSWCGFHRAFGHVTEDCWALRTQIEKLVQTGHLNRYIRQTSPSECDAPRKKRAHTHHLIRRPRYETQGIGQDESMVISVVAAEYKIERVLIDQGSSANILY
ncbi:hypothetical protein CR513_42690, partial [Mucuna pruriens]